MIKLRLDEAERLEIAPDFEEATEGEGGRTQGGAQDRVGAVRSRTIRRYQHRVIAAAQGDQEPIGLAKGLREASRRDEDSDLTDGKLAFYDALETNDSAVKVLADDALKIIARELVATVRKS